MGTTRPATARGEALTRDAVLGAAVALVERDGASALTMRRLGAELGVEAMSIYHHLENRDAVLSGMADRLMGGVSSPPVDLGWGEAGAFFARQLRAVAIAHPRTFSMTAMRPLRSAAALAPVEALLGVVVRDGATPATALVFYRSLASYARGYALAEVSGFTVDASSADGRGALGALDAEAFPVLGGRGLELHGVTSDAAFESGLVAILEGFAPVVARPSDELHPPILGSA